MKRKFFGVKVSDLLTGFVCTVVAFLLWLYFNI